MLIGLRQPTMFPQVKTMASEQDVKVSALLDTSLDDFLMFRLRDTMVCFAKPLGEASTVE
jgi:hypothetical protein